jgi:hypothetical protein
MHTLSSIVLITNATLSFIMLLYQMCKVDCCPSLQICMNTLSYFVS